MSDPKAMRLRQLLRLVAPDDWTSYQHDGSNDALDALCNALDIVMRAGSWLAVGRRADDPQRDATIEPEAWKTDVQPVMWCDELSLRGVRLFDVRFYQAVAMSDFPVRLMRSGGLADAFRVFVIGNPLLRSIAARVDGLSIQEPSGPITFNAGPMRDGLFPSDSGAWPVALKAFDLVKVWDEQGPRSLASLRQYPGTRDVFDIVDRCAAALCDLMGRFLQPLRSGQVKAHGHHVATGQVQSILPAVWSSTMMALDHHGRVGSLDGTAFRPVWDMVSFQPVAPAPSRMEDVTKRVSLIEAFRAQVLENPAFMAAIDAAGTLVSEDATPSYAERMRTGAYPSTSGLWPIAPNEYELGFSWFPFRKPGRSPPDRQLADEVQRARVRLALDVIAVLDAFLAPLREGRVKLVGVPNGPTIQPDIPAAVWRRPDTGFDPVAGTVGRLIRREHEDAADHERMLIEWTAVELIDVAAPSAAPIDTRPLVEPNRSKGGVDEGYSWGPAMEAAFNHLHNEMPRNATEFAKWILEALVKIDGLTPDKKRPDLKYIKTKVKEQNEDFYKAIAHPNAEAAKLIIPSENKGRN